MKWIGFWVWMAMSSWSYGGCINEAIDGHQRLQNQPTELAYKRDVWLRQDQYLSHFEFYKPPGNQGEIRLDQVAAKPPKTNDLFNVTPDFSTLTWHSETQSGSLYQFFPNWSISSETHSLIGWALVDASCAGFKRIWYVLKEPVKLQQMTMDRLSVNQEYAMVAGQWSPIRQEERVQARGFGIEIDHQSTQIWRYSAKEPWLLSPFADY